MSPEPDEAQRPEPTVTSSEVRVSVVRTVRYGPVMVGAAILFGIAGAIASLFFPVAQDADYELWQVAGLTFVIAGAAGLLVGGLLSLLLGVSARRKKGTGVAVQTDVR